MPRQSAEIIIRRFMKTVWDEGQVAAIPEFVTGDYIDHAYNGGTESLGAQISVLRSAFADATHMIEDLLVADNSAMLRARLVGKHVGAFRGVLPSHATIDVKVARWFRLDGRKIAEHWAVLDTVGLFRQIGLDVFAQPPKA